MSADALDYQLETYFGSNEPLLAYYDFGTGSVFTAQSGSAHQAYIRNTSPSYRTGEFDGKIVGATGTSSAIALLAATGSNKFINSGEADFRKNYVEISGSSSIPIKDCSYLFSIEPELSKNGVFFGSFERVVDSIDGSSITSSKGFNLGVNDRGKVFFQSLSRDGEYCFVANELELSQKNVIGLSFGASQVNIFRFDYLNDNIQSSEFPLTASHIKDTTLYLGSSPNYFRGSNERLYSGKMDEFTIFSGQIPSDILFEMGKSLVSDYSFSAGAVTSTGVLSGYVQTYVYKTGVTGAYANITGYTSVRSGLEAFSQSVIYTGNFSIREGDRYYKNFSTYIEEQGYLSGVHANTYNTTGEGAFATLGLQTGSGIISGYGLSGSSGQTNINIPLYELVYLYGTTNQLSGVVNTPVYNTVYITGNDSSGIVLSDDFLKLQKDYIYFMGQR